MRNHIWKDFIPTYHCVRLFDIPASFFVKQGYTMLCIDLDNTLASYRSKSPTSDVTAWIQSLQQANLDILIVSNNRSKRVAHYLTSLNLPFLAPAGKPSPKKVKRYLVQNKIQLKSVLVIGGQILTDCWMANQLGVDSLLTEKLVKEDHWPTWINRLLEKPVLHWLKRNHLLRNWRVVS
jgi:HAD superfamily phosphatase (TIGR01668 family)